MIINPPKEWQESEEKEKTETVQVPYKLRTSSVQVEQLIAAIGEEKLSVKDMLEWMNLKHRENLAHLQKRVELGEDSHQSKKKKLGVHDSMQLCSEMFDF